MTVCNCNEQVGKFIPLQARVGAATRVLREEHQAVLGVLEVFEQALDRLEVFGQAVPASLLEGVLEFLTVFVDKCHHIKEEEVLFPLLKEAGIGQDGGPIGCMLTEHEEGRQYIRQLKESLAGLQVGNTTARHDFVEVGRSYCNLLGQHIMKENRVLFVLADSLLTAPLQQEVVRQFEEIEETRLGPGTHERLHGMIEEWQRQAASWEPAPR